MLFESYIGAQKYRSGLLERYFAPVKGFFVGLLGLFYGRIKPFYSHGARGGSVLPVPAAATLLRRPRGTTA